jgi:hypothetical protein
MRARKQHLRQSHKLLSSDKHWLLYASTDTSEKKAGAANNWTLIRLLAIISLAIATFAQARADERIASGRLRIVARAFRW